MVNLICLACGITYTVRNHEATTRKTCGIKCKFIYQKTKTGVLNNNWKGGIKPNRCHTCDKEFIPGRSRLDQKHCSQKCAGVKRRGIISHNAIINDPRKICKCGNSKSTNSVTCKKCFKILKASNKTPLPTCKCGNNKNKAAKLCKPCSNEKRKIYHNCPICHIDYYKPHPAKTCSRECKIKLLKKDRGGELNSNWKGGRLTKNQKIRASEQYKNWRISVFERDKYTCQECGQIGFSLHAHHIKSFSKYPELRMELSNGVTLCENCHAKKHVNMNYILKRKKVEIAEGFEQAKKVLESYLRI